MLIRLLLLSIIPFLLFASADRALQRMKIEQRVALVIGNNQYDSKKLSNLRNPINDSRAMKKKLQNLGFKVYYGENLTVRQMDKKLRKFSTKLSNGGVGLFFFAGHGVESRGRNYLIGKDSNLDHKDEINYESLELNKVLDKMKNSGNRLNIVLLDACRNDPFSRSGGGGLAKSTAKGTFIVYATSPGDVASDGSGKHGAFTSQILKHIDANGVPIERVFKRVKIGVINSTNQNQRPWVSNDITGDFYFKLPNTNTKTTKALNKLELSKDTNNLQTYPLTITTQPLDAKVSITNIKPRYKDGILLASGKYNIKVSKSGYATKRTSVILNNQALNIKIFLDKKAKAKRPALKTGEKEFWQEIKAEDTKEYYEMYLAEYPNGYYTRDAKRIIALAEAKILKEQREKRARAKKVKKQEELNTWYKIKGSKYGSDFKKFLKNYPNSSHVRLARLKAKKYQNNRASISLNSLMWQDNKEAKIIRKTWQEAIDYCENLTLSGYDDWKLANIDELKELYNKKSKLKNVASSDYWSSSNIPISKYAWYVDFKSGYSSNYNKTNERYVRCTRSGQ